MDGWKKRQKRQGTDLTQCRQALHKFSRADLELELLGEMSEFRRSDTGEQEFNVRRKERQAMLLPT